MPRRQEPMKDGANTEMPRGAVSRRYYPGISEWGNPLSVMGEHPLLNI